MPDGSKYWLTKNFFAGGCGGMCMVIAGHPLDTLKVRMQTMPIAGLGKRPLYKNSLDCFRKTLSKEGWRGFYKGMSTPLLYITPLAASSFSTYTFGKKIQTWNDPTIELTSLGHFNAGVLSGICNPLLVVPIDRVKCILQIQTSSGTTRQYSSPMDVVRKVIQQSGLRGMYKGICITLVRDIPGGGLYFAVYDWTKRKLISGDQTKLSPLATAIAGGAAGVAHWSYAIVPDTIKSRLQTASPGTYPRGARDVLRHALREEGIRVLYRGIGLVVVRAFPANASCFLGYEVGLNFLNRIFPG
eukprot:m.85626 g.85626  ORF g.85626 m.85626 type:complete len:300 (+) comp36453_c0_seq6:204-1103(+)